MPEKTAVIYCRTSTAGQKRDETMDAQEARTARIVDRQELSLLDYGNSGYIKDDGVTGSLLAGRNFAKLIEDIKSKKINPDYIVMFSVSRIAREDESSNDPNKVEQSLIDFAKIKATLISNNVKVMDESGEMSPGSIHFAIKALLSKEEYKLIRERTIAGKEIHFKKGFYARGGKAPFGYRYISTNQDKRGDYKIEIDPLTSNQLKQIFQWFIKGGYQYAAREATKAKFLNPSHTTTNRKNKQKDWTPTTWDPTTVQKIVKHCEKYLGEMEIKLQGVIYKLQAPPILDLATYIKIRQTVKGRTVRTARRYFLSTGYVDCHCDSHININGVAPFIYAR